MKRVLIITNIPSSYRLDLFNSLSINDTIDFNFLFIPDKNVRHKSSIWANTDNEFFKKTIIINKGNPQKSIRLFKFLRNSDFDTIIVGGIPTYFPIIVFSNVLFTSNLYIWWAGTNITETPNFLKRYYRKIMSLFISGGIFYSGMAKNYFENNIKKLPKKSIVIGNNTRFSDKEIEKISKYKITVDDPMFQVISVGFQEKRKNTILLLQAVKILQNKKLKFNTVIVGEGPELRVLKEFVRDNYLKNIFFTGNLNYEEVFQNLKNSDVLVHPSISDSWPQVYNEASYCNLGIMVSNNSGIDNEYIKNYKAEVTFSPQNPLELAVKLNNLIANPMLLEELKHAVYNDSINNDGHLVKQTLIDYLI